MVVVRIALVVAVQAIESARIASRVTESTRNIVRSLERELVLESCRLPRRSTVALLTIKGKVQGRMVRPQQVVSRMAGVAIRGDRLEVSAGMTTRAVEAGMCAGEREEVMHEVRACPTYRSMAPLAAGSPAVRRVVGGVGPGETSLVAELALQRSPPELTDGRLEVAALTRSHGVRGYEMETRPGVLGDEPRRRPVHLSMATLAIEPERRGVRIGVAPTAAPGDIDRDRPPVVVTPQAGRFGVRALQRIAGFNSMVEKEVFPEGIPAICNVTDTAVARKCAMRHKRTPPFAPPPPRYDLVATDNEHNANCADQYRKEYFLSACISHLAPLQMHPAPATFMVKSKSPLSPRHTRAGLATRRNI